MANVSWNFYRARRRLDLAALVSNRRIWDYPSYLSYCAEVHVVPVSNLDFDREFGPVLSNSPKPPAPVRAVVDVPDASPPAPVQNDSLEATVWLAGVEGETHKSPTLAPPSKSLKKKKSKEEPQE